jgi:type VI secretion system protein ImpB
MTIPPSVAPRERVNIVYEAAAGGAQQEKELPLKLLVLGDFSGRREPTPLEDRAATAIAKETFDEVLAARDVALSASVPDRLSREEGGSLELALRFRALADFSPELLARAVPQLARLLALRDALSALKGPLGNSPAFRRRIQDLLADPAARPALLDEVNAIDP